MAHKKGVGSSRNGRDSKPKMLALEHHYTDMSLGSYLSLDNLIYLRQLAGKHGFELAQLRSFDRPLDEEEWQQVVEARTRLI